MIFAICILQFTISNLQFSLPKVTLLHSDRHSTIVEFNNSEFQVETTGTYHRIHISTDDLESNLGTTFEIGKSKLPGIFYMIGISGSTRDLQVKIIELETDTLKGLVIYPLQPPTTETLNLKPSTLNPQPSLLL